MDRGLYIAASGMLAEMARQDLLANDLANTSTPGYKADRAEQKSFADVLLTNTKTGEAIGPIGPGAAITRQATDMTAAPLKDTNEPLDFAITGDGFFAVRTPQGQRYTRNGSFQTASNGQLVDQLRRQGPHQQGRPLTVGADGPNAPARLAVFNARTPRKPGAALLTGTAAGRATGNA